MVFMSCFRFLGSKEKIFAVTIKVPVINGFDSEENGVTEEEGRQKDTNTRLNYVTKTC